MRDVVCRYKIFGGFGLLLLLNGGTSLLFYMLLFKSKTPLNEIDLINDAQARYVYTIVIGLWLLTMTLLATQCRFIIANREKITFINPVLPFLRQTYAWSDFDYYAIASEYSRYDSHDAVWLVKNDKLKVRFSSFYYSNFDDLLDQISTPYRKINDHGSITQLMIILKLKRIEP